MHEVKVPMGMTAVKELNMLSVCSVVLTFL